MMKVTVFSTSLLFITKWFFDLKFYKSKIKQKSNFKKFLKNIGGKIKTVTNEVGGGVVKVLGFGTNVAKKVGGGTQKVIKFGANSVKKIVTSDVTKKVASKIISGVKQLAKSDTAKAIGKKIYKTGLEIVNSDTAKEIGHEILQKGLDNVICLKFSSKILLLSQRKI